MVSLFQEATLTQRINLLHRKLMFLSRFIDNLDQPIKSVYFNYIPVFAKETLVSVLNDLGICHVTCDANVDSACVSLAAHLQCPVVADNGDLLLHEFHDPPLVKDCSATQTDRFVFMPMRLLSLEPMPVVLPPNSIDTQETKSKYCLIGHAFCPSASSIHKLPYHMRPFLPLYLRLPGTGPSFPDHLQTNSIEPRSSVEEVKTRIVNLIDWLCKLENPWHVFEETFLKLEEQQAAQFIRQLIAITEALKPDIQTGENLSSFLTLAPLSPAKQLQQHTPVDLLTWLQLKENKQCDSTQNKILAMITQENVNESQFEMKSLLSRAPNNFILLYRLGLVSPVMFCRVFSHSWVLNPMVEDLTKSPPSDSSMGMRYLQYCLSLGFAIQCGQVDETKPGVMIEVSRSPPNMLGLRTIQLSPFYLPLSTNPTAVCHAFLRQQLGYDHPSDTVSPNWLPSVALTLALWYVNQNVDVSGKAMDLYAHPTLLSVALCTCVMACSSAPDLQTINAHYNSLADSFEQTLPLRVPVVHEVNQLQLIYMSLLSLIRILDAITMTSVSANFTQTSLYSFAVMHFLPPWFVFGSSRLVHHMSRVLSAEQSVEARQQAVLATWLPKLLPESQENANTEISLVFNCLVDLVKTISSTLHPVKFQSKLDIVEPPPTRQQRVVYQSNTTRSQSFGPVRSEQGDPRFPYSKRGVPRRPMNEVQRGNNYNQPRMRGVYSQRFARAGHSAVNRNAFDQSGQGTAFTTIPSPPRNYGELSDSTRIGDNLQTEQTTCMKLNSIADSSTSRIASADQNRINSLNCDSVVKPRVVDPCSHHETFATCSDRGDSEALLDSRRHSMSVASARKDADQLIDTVQVNSTNDSHRSHEDKLINEWFSHNPIRGSKPFPHKPQDTQSDFGEDANQRNQPLPSQAFSSPNGDDVRGDVRFQRNRPSPRGFDTKLNQQRASYSSRKSDIAVALPGGSYSLQAPEITGDKKNSDRLDPCLPRRSLPVGSYNNVQPRQDPKTSNNVRGDARLTIVDKSTASGILGDPPAFRSQYENPSFGGSQRYPYNRATIPRGQPTQQYRGTGRFSRPTANRGFRGRGGHQDQQQTMSAWSMSAIQDAVSKVQSIN